MTSNRTARTIRWALLLLLLAWATYESVMHQILGGAKSPSVHALCPYGAVESLQAILFTGAPIQKIYSGTFLLMGVTLLIAILFRRSFCGLLCPFGTLQELFARLGQKVFKRRFVVPAKWDRPLRGLKYAMLILTAVMAWVTGQLWMAPFDPYSAYGHLTSLAESVSEDPLNWIGFGLLALSVVGSFFVDRFFCKYLCPAGALYAIIGKLSPTRIVRNNDTCVNCSACNRVCPVNIDVAAADQVKTAECLNCNECVAACPIQGALEIRTGKRSFTPLVMLVLVAALFFVPVWVAQLAGVYQVLPVTAAAAEALLPGEMPSAAAIEGIRGSMSIADAALTLGLDESTFRTMFQVPAEIPSTTRLKEVVLFVPGYDFHGMKSVLQEAAGENSTEN